MSRKWYIVYVASLLTLIILQGLQWEGHLNLSGEAPLPEPSSQATQDLPPPEPMKSAHFSEQEPHQEEGKEGNDMPKKPEEMTEADWKDHLSGEQYHVLREEGTEKPFTSPLLHEKRDGIYVCAACGYPLFRANSKFDSGTGWPSFDQAIPFHVDTKIDNSLGVPRTEYHCARCNSHLGHVFSDGPTGTGQRYCNNGVALRFVPLDELPEDSEFRK